MRYISLYLKDWKQQRLRDSKSRVPLGLRMCFWLTRQHDLSAVMAIVAFFD